MGGVKRMPRGAIGRADLYEFDPDKIFIVGLDPPYTGKEYRGHALYRYKVRQPTPAFVASIREKGVEVPLLFVKDGDQVLVQDGALRVLAARQVKREQIEQGAAVKDTIRVPGVPRRKNELDQLGTVLATNHHRHADPPTHDADRAARMLVRGASYERVCNELSLLDGKGQPVKAGLDALLSLNEAGVEVREAVDQGQLSVTAAAALAALPAAVQKEELAKLLQSGDTTVREVFRRVRARKAGKEAGPAPTRKGPTPSLVRKLAAAPGLLKDDNIAGQVVELLEWIRGGPVPAWLSPHLEAVRRIVS